MSETTGVARVPLRAHNGSVRAHALVDVEATAITSRRWYLHSDGYAARDDYSTGKRRVLLMHRVVLGLDPGDPRDGDHINRDRLDNRRANLRVVTRAQNMQNAGGHSDGTSMHRGVSFDSRTQRWIAAAMIDGQRHWLGRHDSEDEAARVCAAFRAEHMPYCVEVV